VTEARGTSVRAGLKHGRVWTISRLDLASLPFPANPGRPATATLRCVNGVATGLLSIGSLLILYWSCIVPLLVAVFERPPAPGGRDEGAAPELPNSFTQPFTCCHTGINTFAPSRGT